MTSYWRYNGVFGGFTQTSIKFDADNQEILNLEK